MLRWVLLFWLTAFRTAVWPTCGGAGSRASAALSQEQDRAALVFKCRAEANLLDICSDIHILFNVYCRRPLKSAERSRADELCESTLTTRPGAAREHIFSARANSGVDGCITVLCSAGRAVVRGWAFVSADCDSHRSRVCVSPPRRTLCPVLASSRLRVNSSEWRRLTWPRRWRRLLLAAV